MPNHVTNRLEIKADSETVQKVMNFLKGENEEDGTPCYIDFNKIIPMPEELLIDASSDGKLGMEYLAAMQRKPFYTPDDLKAIQRVEELQEERRKEVLQLGASYLSNIEKYGYPTWYEWSIATWAQNGMPTTNILKSRTSFGLTRLGIVCRCLFKNFPRYSQRLSFTTPTQMKTWGSMWAEGFSKMVKST